MSESVPLGDTQLLHFQIPYGIRVGEGFDLRRDNDEIELELYGGEDVPELEVFLGGRFANLRFSQTQKRDTIHYEGEFTVEGDRLGRTLSTDVLMHFSDEFMETIPREVTTNTPVDYHKKGTIMGSSIDPPLDKHIIVWGVNFLNKFLEQYRFFENEYWIQTLTPQTIQEFHLWRFKQGTIDRHRQRIWTRGPSKGGKAETEDLQEMLRSTTSIPVTQRLRLNARDSIDIGDYQQSVIQAAQVVELWVIYAYILISKHNGDTESEIENEIIDDRGRYVKIYDFYQKIDSFYEFDFRETEAFDEWEKFTKETRDRVIHRGHEPTRQESFKAYEAAMEAIWTFQEEFKEALLNETINEMTENEIPGSNILIEKEEEDKPF